MTGTMSAIRVSLLMQFLDDSSRVRTLDDEVRAEDTHGGDTNTRLGGTVRGAQAGKDDGAGAAHGTKEGL